MMMRYKINSTEEEILLPFDFCSQIFDGKKKRQVSFYISSSMIW